MKSEKEKASEGLLYDANYDGQLLRERAECADMTHELNQMRPSMAAEREALLRRLLGEGDYWGRARRCPFSRHSSATMATT